MSHRDSVLCCIEAPRGSRNKYEYDRATRRFRLDRVLHSSIHFPGDYGFIPETLAPDGDQLDVMVLTDDATFPGCVIEARPIALLETEEFGVTDHKILAVPTKHPRFANVESMEDLPQHWRLEIESFFETYRTLEGVPSIILGWAGADRAWEIIETAEQAGQAGRADAE